MANKIRFSILLLLLSFSGFAQQKGDSIIKGYVLDSANRKPIEYAAIAANDIATGKTVGGAITDAKGYFKVEGLKAGKYELEIDFVGYRLITTENLTISSDKTVIDLGSIYLASAVNRLKNVVVVGSAPIVENKPDRIVYNAANDITSQGGVAIDILRKVPQVTVDVDGKVELQGNSNVRFLINGKPSSMFGNSLADALASIPASQIKSIEAITSPGAKYDAQGTGGIINIILKDNKAKGMNGSANISAGTRLENGSFNLNFRRNNFGISTYVNGNLQRRSHSPSSQQRTSFDSAGNITYLNQNGYADFERNGYQIGTSIDWDLSKKDNLAASLSFNRFANNSNGNTLVEEIKQGIAGGTDTLVRNRYSASSGHSASFDWSVGYTHKFNTEGNQLDFLYSASKGTPYSYFLQNQTYIDHPYPYTGSTGTNPGKDYEHNFSLDYSLPIHDKFSIETGAKLVLQNIDSRTGISKFIPDSNYYETDSVQSYELFYKLKVYAGYLSAKFPINKFLNVSAGLRYEYTNVQTIPTSVLIPSYGNLIPSIIFSRSYGNNMLKLAYTRRLERADYEDLNPFINMTDPYNISVGNPLLKPEISNNFELGYNRSLKKGGNVYLAIFERINTQDHKSYTKFYPSFSIGDSIYENVSVTTRANIGTEYNSGLVITGSFPITEKLNIRENIILTHKYYANNFKTANTTGVGFRLNLNLNYRLSKSLIAEAFGDYRSPTKSIQGKQAQRITYTFAFRKFMMEKKASIGFTATNPFNHYINQETTTFTSNYTATTIRKIPFQSFGISFNYKFGKLQFKKEKENENDFLNNPPSL